MKLIAFTILLLFLTNCSTHTVKLGKRCTKLAADNTYEKSLIWLIDKKSVNDFDKKINKENCEKNGDNS
tara:strand:+ start:809 stop:1015 length:207 start_codon:yes stop_codon:yes gene_type:complete